MSQNSEPRNKKLGIGIYYTTIIITIVVMIAALLIIKNEDPDIASYYRYMVAFYTLGGFLSLGVIVREFFAEIYNTKKMILKLLIVFFAMAAGTLTFIFIKKTYMAMIMMFAGFAVLLYSTVPTVPKNAQDIK